MRRFPEWRRPKLISCIDRITSENYFSPGTKSAIISVTRFGDLLDFGPLFKAFGNN